MLDHFYKSLTLNRQRFTAAELTFAALAAPALFPVEYRGVLPALDAVSTAMREEISKFSVTSVRLIVFQPPAPLPWRASSRP
jgi:hypothetical protein